jgi:MFS transporter, DHA2 family, multidrug resistance protein
VVRELTATAPVVNLRIFKDATFASATLVAFVMFGMLMGSMFLLPVFTQESLHYTATLSGIVLMPRTLAMMVVSPIVGWMYNRVQPAFIVATGVVLFSIGSWQLSGVTLDTSSTQMIFPLVVTGAAFACLFVPLTTAALSHIERHLMADAAGLNSFVRQIGGSIGLTVFATLFTNYSVEARAGLATHVSALRPEVVERMGALKAGLIAHGHAPAVAQLLTGRLVGGARFRQATVLSFDRVFLFQGILFLAVLPLLLFLRVHRTGTPIPVEATAE